MTGFSSSIRFLNPPAPRAGYYRHAPSLKSFSGASISKPAYFQGDDSKAVTSRWKRWKQRGKQLFLAASAGAFLFTAINFIPNAGQKIKALHTRAQYQPSDNFEVLKNNLLQEFKAQYINEGDGIIDWYELADIVEHIARQTKDDETFRHMTTEILISLRKYLDTKNSGLLPELDNIDASGQLIYPGEQALHLFGSVLGFNHHLPDFFGPPTQVLTEPPMYWAWELSNTAITTIRGKGPAGTVNIGDIRLSERARQLRNAFWDGGRFTLVNSLRELLVPRPSDEETDR